MGALASRIPYYVEITDDDFGGNDVWKVGGAVVHVAAWIAVFVLSLSLHVNTFQLLTGTAYLLSLTGLISIAVAGGFVVLSAVFLVAANEQLLPVLITVLITSFSKASLLLHVLLFFYTSVVNDGVQGVVPVASQDSVSRQLISLFILNLFATTYTATNHRIPAGTIADCRPRSVNAIVGVPVIGPL